MTTRRAQGRPLRGLPSSAASPPHPSRHETQCRECDRRRHRDQEPNWLRHYDSREWELDQDFLADLLERRLRARTRPSQ